MVTPVIAFTLSLLLCTVAARPDLSKVFLEKRDASAVISRHRRANAGGEETSKIANLERECVEEVCSYTEALEIFKDSYHTDIFWSVYIDGDQCAGNPCKNGALCSDSVGGYDCVCKSGFSGVHCDTDNTICEVSKDKGCSQFCKPGYQSYECSCAAGWKLQGKETCVPEGESACGKVEYRMWWNTRKSSNSHGDGQTCEQGKCPWQALLRSEESVGFCSGVILKEDLVLTTAQCAFKYGRFQVLVGKAETTTEAGEQVLHVGNVIQHPLYEVGRPGNDLAVVQLTNRITFNKNAKAVCLPEKDFAESVLMSDKQDAVVTGWKESLDGSANVQGSLSFNHLTYNSLTECRERHAGLVTNKMFCTAPRTNANCAFGAGSAALAYYRDVFFLTGVLSRAPGLNCQEGYVFQKVSRFLPWLQPFMAGGGGQG